jgi:TRAP-type C4-dicarboxylate transport system permease small subunit
VDNAGGKMKTICIICRIIVSVIAMLMLAWAIYTGFRILTRQREGTYYPLASPVGVASIMFGVIYFIIGLWIIAELVVELAKQLQGKVDHEIVIHQVDNINIKCFV